jgi:hypothetical protein
MYFKLLMSQSWKLALYFWHCWICLVLTVCFVLFFSSPTLKIFHEWKGPIKCCISTGKSTVYYIIIQMQLNKISPSLISLVKSMRDLRFTQQWKWQWQGWRWREYVSLKCWYLPMSLHGIAPHKNNIVVS